MDFPLQPPAQCQAVWSFSVTRALDMKQCNGGRGRRRHLVSCQASCPCKAISVDHARPGLHFSKWAKDERFSVPIENPQSHPFILSCVHYQKLLFKTEQKLLCCIKSTVNCMQHVSSTISIPKHHLFLDFTVLLTTEQLHYCFICSPTVFFTFLPLNWIYCQ